MGLAPDGPEDGAYPRPTGGVLLDASRWLEEAAVRAGVLCSNCRGPIEGEGVEYLVFDVDDVREDGRASAVTARSTLCLREECAEVREALDADAHAKRPFVAWTLLPVGPFGRKDGKDVEAVATRKEVPDAGNYEGREAPGEGAEGEGDGDS